MIFAPKLTRPYHLAEGAARTYLPGNREICHPAAEGGPVCGRSSLRQTGSSCISPSLRCESGGFVQPGALSAIRAQSCTNAGFPLAPIPQCNPNKLLLLRENWVRIANPRDVDVLERLLPAVPRASAACALQCRTVRVPRRAPGIPASSVAPHCRRPPVESRSGDHSIGPRGTGGGLHAFHPVSNCPIGVR